jgi:hypothetical protein
VTAVLEVFPTVAVNCWVCPPAVIETGVGETETETEPVTGGVRWMVAEPVAAALATLVAVMVTVWADVMEEGAV